MKRHAMLALALGTVLAGVILGALLTALVYYEGRVGL